jgi:hypothetical protein
MTTNPRDAFTEGQWDVLTSAGAAIARSVAVVAGPASDSDDELDAYVRFLHEDDRPGGVLVTAIAEATRGRLAAGNRPSDSDPFMAGLAAARQAGAILSIVTTAADAAEVRGWYLRGGEVVAGASREGGVLGLGGARVGDAERQTLTQLEEALGG